MTQGNSSNRKQPAATLRRSPRFLRYNRVDPDDPKTPNPEEKRSNRVPSSDPPPLSLARKVSSKKTQKLRTKEVPKKANKSAIGLQSSVKSTAEPRRSGRLNGGVGGFGGPRRSVRFSDKGKADSSVENIKKSKRKGLLEGGKIEKDIGLHRQFVGKTDKRVTRSSTRGISDENVEDTRNSKYNGFTECAATEFSNKRVLSDEEKAKLGSDKSKQLTDRLEKMMTRSCNRGNTNGHGKKIGNGKCSGVVECVSTESLDKGLLSEEEKAEAGMNISKTSTGKFEKRMTRSSVASKQVIVGGEERKERDIDEGREKVGVKRKRNQVEEGHGIVLGWTKDQELALQRAYFSAKPTPHFWKKVARLVPGKSAQDCFDKVHSDHLTPPQPQSRIRSKRTNSSLLSLSTSELLNSTLTKLKKKPRYAKLKGHLAHKTMRNLLQNQCNVDRDYEADLFSVLEPTLNPSTQALQGGMMISTPERDQEKPEFLKRCQERSSTHKKHLSRFGNSRGATITSPPVLKQVKSKFLHEKYIDQLHCREAKRKAASARAAKSSKGKVDKMDTRVQKMDAVKDAKNALIFDAKDAINQFQHLQATAMNNFSEADEDDFDGDGDEDEEIP